MAKFKGISIISRLGRFDQWWNYKMPLLISVLLATCYLAELPFVTTFRLILLQLGSFIVGGIFAYMINDATDVEEDEKTNKNNVFSKKSTVFVYCLLYTSPSPRDA